MGIPKPTKAAQNSAFNPFFRASMIGRPGTHATVQTTGKVREQSSQYGDQIIVEVIVKGTRYDWGIKVNSPNHRELFARLGKSAKGKIPVEVKTGSFGSFLAIERSKE